MEPTNEQLEQYFASEIDAERIATATAIIVLEWLIVREIRANFKEFYSKQLEYYRGLANA